jgi:hypothetical protein
MPARHHNTSNSLDIGNGFLVFKTGFSGVPYNTTMALSGSRLESGTVLVYLHGVNNDRQGTIHSSLLGLAAMFSSEV